MDFIVKSIFEAWHVMLEASIYIIFGLLISGILKVFLNPAAVARHLGEGRFRSVFKAAFLGIPIPLCSCGVLPAAAAFKKQGANNGAVTAFLISTPESGVDSMAVTYALLDPIMTVFRPLAAFVTAVAAGLTENLLNWKNGTHVMQPDLSCPVDGCCDGIDCPPEIHSHHHTVYEKVKAGLRFSFTDVWSDMASWFFVGVILAGLITAAIPDDIIGQYLGGGLHSMLLMLIVGIPLYICATASTPIAAALILKGVSPGAALVFLLAGPATNVTSLTVLIGVLGKRAAVIYLSVLAIFTVLFGLLVDYVYFALGFSAAAIAGQAAEVIPSWLQWTGAFFLLALSLKPLKNSIMSKLRLQHGGRHDHIGAPVSVKKVETGDAGCSTRG